MSRFTKPGLWFGLLALVGLASALIAAHLLIPALVGRDITDLGALALFIALAGWWANHNQE